MRFDRRAIAVSFCIFAAFGLVVGACDSDDPAAPAEDQASCTAGPDTVDFGPVTVGQSVTRVLEIENTGEQEISGNVGVSTSAPCDGYTIVSGDGNFTLNPGEIHTVRVRLEPASLGEKTCRITTGNSACGSFVLLGSAEDPPACDVQPSVIDFGKVAVQTQRDTTFTIKNSGGGILGGFVSETCDYITILSGGGSYELAASESLLVTVRFEPENSGSFNCTIETGDALCSDVSVTGATEFPQFTGFAVGQSGTILRTVDGGETWVRMISGTGAGLLDVDFADASTGTVVGSNGRILRTTDGGDTWTQQTSGSSSVLVCVVMTDANTAMITGNNGTILYTTDGGATWNPQTSGTTDPLTEISFVDANNGWVVGFGGIALRTVDGGSTWNPLDVGSDRILTGVWFVDANNGTVVTGSGSWTQELIPQILTTTDGGNTWSVKSPMPAGAYNDVMFTSVTTGTVAVADGNILRTSDGGNTWTQFSSGLQNINGIDFMNHNIGVAVGFGGKITQTFDGGKTWFPRASGTTVIMYSVSLTGF